MTSDWAENKIRGGREREGDKGGRERGEGRRERDKKKMHGSAAAYLSGEKNINKYKSKTTKWHSQTGSWFVCR